MPAGLAQRRPGRRALSCCLAPERVGKSVASAAAHKEAARLGAASTNALTPLTQLRGGPVRGRSDGRQYRKSKGSRDRYGAEGNPHAGLSLAWWPLTCESVVRFHHPAKIREVAVPSGLSCRCLYMMSGGAEQHQDNNDAERHAEEPKDDRHGQGLPTTVTVTGTR